MTKDFKHQYKIQIRLKDIDNLGHVNHANYLTFIELARVKYYDTVLGTNTDWRTQHGQIMARIEIDYKDAIEYDDEVIVYTRCSKLGTKSFELSSLLTKPRNGDVETIAAEGKSVIVCYDYQTKKAIEIPNEYRQKLEQYDNLK